ncbi:hypothetical protein HYV71_04355 [Candidatus Uhrbacteria bacterium]|nr:hypothetical protein [Candidatus Uhrbacteria bacterium]
MNSQNRAWMRFGVAGMSSLILAVVLVGVLSAATTSAATIDLINPIKATSIPELVNYILRGLFGLIGVVALVIFLYGGFTWMTSEGSEKKIKKGWDTMIWGALGLGIIFASFILVRFLLNFLLEETTATGTSSSPSATGGTGSVPARPTP